jgi:hypothetical protein
MPMGFFVLALLALAGGIVHDPCNFDAMSYRLPRVLHWLATGQWHWAHTAFPRLNVRACGQEWFIAPVIALTKGAHLTFLPSFISFLLLPGLFFSVFTRFGIKPRVAWPWMWICATGYGYVTQAGGLANDLMGATYVLAAFDFALRVRQSGRLGDFWFFLLATALMTGVKASNIPLLLPLFLLACPRWPLLLAKPVANFFVILLAALASFLPTAILNQMNCGDWTGMKLEGAMKPYPAQLGLNSVNVLLLNLAPPIFPLASHWNHFLGSRTGLDFVAVNSWSMPELDEEGAAGLGLGICLLLMLSLIATRVIHRHADAQTETKTLPLYWKFILWSPYLSLLAFCIKAQVVNSVTRLLTPYWAVLIVPILLFGFDESLVRRRWWKRLVALVFAAAIVIMVLEPSHPLWPAQTILRQLHKAYPASTAIVRAQSVYEIFGQRTEAFAPLVAALPPDARVLGMVTFADPEASLWWPLGSRRIEHVTPDDTLQDLQARGIKYVLSSAFCVAIGVHVEDLIQKYHAEVVAKVPLTLLAGAGTVDWYILKIPSEQ